MSKIGLLGGTFDPVHSGHIALARAALKEAELDQVLVMPAPDPPHKRTGSITPFNHRVAMLQLAIEGQEKIALSLVESGLPRPSYTIDTVNFLRQKGDSIAYFFILGVDAFLDILNWKDHDELVRQVGMIVARRRGVERSAELSEIAAKTGYQPTKEIWRGRGGQRDILFLREVPPTISSSAIRRLLLDGDDCADLVDPKVLAYITDHGLYRGVI